MRAEKFYEKRLTFPGDYGTILEQSAPRFHTSEIGDCTKTVCEGGGTGRRARLRCVWFILGGSNPLLRTMTRNPHECLKIKCSCGFLFVLECADANECKRFQRLLTLPKSSKSRQKVVKNKNRGKRKKAPPNGKTVRWSLFLCGRRDLNPHSDGTGA